MQLEDGLGFKGIDSKSQKAKEAREKKNKSIRKENNDDLSTEEFIQLGMKYLKIPLALILVEAFYWFRPLQVIHLHQFKLLRHGCGTRLSR